MLASLGQAFCATLMLAFSGQASASLDDRVEHVCTVEALVLHEDRATGHGRSEVSAEDARAAATDEACASLGAAAGCTSEPGYVQLGKGRQTSSYSFSFSTEKGSTEHRVFQSWMEVAPVLNGELASAKSRRSESDACRLAERRACGRLFGEGRACPSKDTLILVR